MLKNNKRTQDLKDGFTVIELLVVAPIVLLVIGAFITVVVNMVGDVLASRTSGVLTYSIQDALDHIESDVKLSTTFLAQSNITLTSPQGYNNDTTAFNNVDPTNGDMLILNTLATTGNPISASSGLIYLTNSPNSCTSTQVSQNTPMTMNVIYFIKNSSLWRRTIMPATYKTGGCSVPWQQPSCNPTYMTANPGSPTAFCVSQDMDLVDNINPGDFHIQYFSNGGSTTVNTVASDSTQTVATRNSALQGLTTVGASITVNTTASGRSISQSGSIRATKLDVNASSLAVVTTATTPSAPVVTASLSQPTSAVFTWPTVTGASSYTVDWSINGGTTWTNGFTNQNTTTFTPPSCATSNAPCTTHTNVVNVRVSATNSAGTSGYGTTSLTIPLWAPLTLQNGWTNYNSSGISTAAYTKTSSGMIMLKGLIKGGTATSTTIIATLPLGYRPSYSLIFQNEANNAAGRVDVYSDGTIRFQIGGNPSTDFSLDNINFVPAGTGTWTNLTPLNGWVNDNGGSIFDTTLAYMNDSAGRVRLRGYITSGTTTSGTPIATLPVAEMPANYTHISADAGNANAHYSLDPSVNQLVAKGYTNAWLSIQGLYYPGTYPSTGACTVAWCALTFQNSWHNYTYPPYASAAYTKGADGVVELKGLISGGAANTIATLPSGYRPAQTLIIPTESNNAYGRINIDTGGNIIFQIGSTTWFSLDSISFMADGS